LVWKSLIKITDPSYGFTILSLYFDKVNPKNGKFRFIFAFFKHFCLNRHRQDRKQIFQRNKKREFGQE